jgi:DNA-binding NarL/FixJ family response regulator
MIRAMVADDQAVVRAGLRMILESEPDIEVVAEASNGLEAIEKIRETDPDVALMDIRMPHLDGIEATRRVVESRARTRVLVLTTYDMDENIYDALKAGAAGFLVKTDSPARLIEGVRALADGDALVTPDVTRRLIARFIRGPRPSPEHADMQSLTAREREVLLLVARGMSNAEIARELWIGEATAKSHVAKILDKLGQRDRVHLVVLAYERGLVAPGGSD